MQDYSDLTAADIAKQHQMMLEVLFTVIVHLSPDARILAVNLFDKITTTLRDQGYRTSLVEEMALFLDRDYPSTPNIPI